MPLVEIPIREVKEIKGLKNDADFRSAAAKLCKYVDEHKALETKIAELRPLVSAALTARLEEQEKSVIFRRTIKQLDGTTLIKAYQLSRVEREAGNVLDKTRLLKYITAAKLKKCYVKGKTPAPTVSVTPIESKE